MPSGRTIFDLRGRVFNKLTVLGVLPRAEWRSSHALWRCRCVCGKEVDVEEHALRKCKSAQCGDHYRGGHSITPGQTYGRLTTVSVAVGYKHPGTWWLCTCSCGSGREVYARPDQLAVGRIRSCGCWRRAHHTKRLTTHGACHTPGYSMWSNAKARARRDGVPWDLPRGRMPVIPDVCPVLGIPLEKSRVRWGSDASPSLDRLIPELGYVLGNVSIISARANRIKNDASVDELVAVARWVATRQEEERWSNAT